MSTARPQIVDVKGGSTAAISRVLANNIYHTDKIRTEHPRLADQVVLVDMRAARPNYQLTSNPSKLPILLNHIDENLGRLEAARAVQLKQSFANEATHLSADITEREKQRSQIIKSIDEHVRGLHNTLQTKIDELASKKITPTDVENTLATIIKEQEKILKQIDNLMINENHLEKKARSLQASTGKAVVRAVSALPSTMQHIARPD
jgi:hypothetical protein